MTVSLVAVMSLDGKLTRHDEPDIHAWVSAEDQTHFQGLLANHDAIVMGSGTYEVVRDQIHHSPDKLRVVLTSHPDDYADQVIADQLEFLTATPAELVTMLESRGYQNLLVVGGHQMISDFLAAKLLDRLYLTVEPRLFGSGQPLTNPTIPLDVTLELENHQKLNATGTLLLTYHISK